MEQRPNDLTRVECPVCKKLLFEASSLAIVTPCQEGEDGDIRAFCRFCTSKRGRPALVSFKIAIAIPAALTLECACGNNPIPSQSAETP